jgi:protoheme IX farnesyltransferase
MIAAATSGWSSALADLRVAASVFKLRIAGAITFSAMAGLAVAPGPALTVVEIAALGAAVMLSAAAAGAFNQYAERELDRRMARTRNRPFATGRLKAGPLWLAVIASTLLIAVAIADLALNWAVALHVFLGAFVYGIVYTVWLKRRTWLNIVLGGLAGSFAVLAGASAVDPALGPAPIILAIVLFLWTPPHFWSLAAAMRDEYAAAGVPMLPVVVGLPKAAWVILGHTIALVFLSLLPWWHGMGPIYLAGAVLGGGYFIGKSWSFVRRPDRAAALANFRASLIQLTLLQMGAIIDRLTMG